MITSALACSADPQQQICRGKSSEPSTQYPLYTCLGNGWERSLDGFQSGPMDWKSFGRWSTLRHSLSWVSPRRNRLHALSKLTPASRTVLIWTKCQCSCILHEIYPFIPCNCFLLGQKPDLETMTSILSILGGKSVNGAWHYCCSHPGARKRWLPHNNRLFLGTCCRWPCLRREVGLAAFQRSRPVSAFLWLYGSAISCT